MKRIAILSIFIFSLVLVFGCGESPKVTNSGIDIPNSPLVQRPNFVDTRPQAEIEAAILKPDISFMNADKKPPKPPPDTGGNEDPNPDPAHKYAYIVGISNYEGTANDLQFCDDDAREMKAYLQSQGFVCQMDLDLQATADNIVAGLNWLASSAAPGDEIAFCYSGHGYKAPGYGSSIISTDLYYITHGYVMQIFNAANCTKKLATLDACVIGDFHSDCQIGTLMATASNKSDSYDAPDLNNGAWTYYWLEAAEDVGLPFGEDIAVYAEDGMAAWAAQYHLRVSPKHTDKYTGMFDI